MLTGDKGCGKRNYHCGNLSPDKAGYVYQLGDVNVFKAVNAETYLKKLGNMDYKGFRRINSEGSSVLCGHGDSLDGCGGEFGEYVK